jgi:hypothetical protein
MSKEIDTAIDAAHSMDAIEREAQLKFGPNVRVEFHPEYPAEDIKAPDSDNYRFAAGQTVAGVTLNSDLRNLDGMAEEIRAVRQVTTPLVAVKRDDGTVHLKQGFRRFGGAARIRAAEPNSPLGQKLRMLPVILYSGLTAEQEKELVNDQKSKKFSKAEVFNIFLENMKGGYNWVNVAVRMYRQIAEVTNSLDEARKIDNIGDPKEREKEVKRWLLSYVYQGWVSAFLSGPKLTNAWMHTYLWEDGYKGVSRPEVIMNSIRQKALHAKVLEDRNAGEYISERGEGPRMLKLYEEYKEQDAKKYDENGNRIKPDNSGKVRLKNLKDIEDLITAEEKEGPTLLSRIYKISLKGGGDPDATRLVRNFHKCITVYDQHKEYLNPQTRELLKLILDGVDGSHEELAKVLAANYEQTKEEKPKAKGIKAGAK